MAITSERPAATSAGQARRLRLTRWIPAAALAVLAVSFVVSGNLVRAAGALGIAALAAALTTYQDRRGRAFTSLAPTAWFPIIVPAVISRLIEDPVKWAPSLILLLFAATMALVASWGIDPRRPVVRAVTWFVTAIRVVVATIIGVVVLLPLGIARLWRRSDPLGTGKGGTKGSAWHDIAQLTATPARTFRIERAESSSVARSTMRMVPQAIGLVVIVLAVDFGLGWAWQEATGTKPAPATTVSDPVGITKGATGDIPPDPRESLPALADSPWAHQWFREWRKAPSYYWPYLLWRPAPFEGEYLNIGPNGERKTYRTPGVTKADAPEVAFLGGSTTYGIAQRDEHTISSEVARLAEADGMPIVPHNYGVSGYVNWQEMLEFEQLAADPTTRPDVAVFYDGCNEIAAQKFGVVGVPAHTALDDVEDALDQPSIKRNPDAPVQSVLQVQARDVLRIYQDHSASGQIVAWVRDQLDSPADAAPTQDRPPTDEEIDASIDVYERGRGLILQLAEKYGVRPLLFWQPWQMYSNERAAMEGVGEPTINITDAFDDHQDVYIDGCHHNEEGAEIVAAAMWEHIRPEVEAWYEDHP